MGVWDGLFQAGMPGVVQATITPARGAVRTINAHWWRDQVISQNGDYRVLGIQCQLKALDADLADMRRGCMVMIAGTEYQAVADAETNGHGISTLYLEPK